MGVAGGADAAHAGFREILILVADILGRRHEIDHRLFAERAVHGRRQVGEAARLTRPAVEQTRCLGMIQQPQHHIDAIADPDEIAQLAAVGVIRVMGFE